MLARIRVVDDDEETWWSEWTRLFDGVSNNQPDLVREWQAISASQTKREFRKSSDHRETSFAHRDIA